MSFENLTAELTLLVDEIEGDQGDRHKIYLRIRAKTSRSEGHGHATARGPCPVGVEPRSRVGCGYGLHPVIRDRQRCYLFNAAGLVHLRISFGEAL